MIKLVKEAAPAAVELAPPGIAVSSQAGAPVGSSRQRRSRPLAWPRRPPLGERSGEIDPTGVASSRLLGLWIDLLRQAGGGPPSGDAEPQGGLGRRHLNALDFLRHGPRFDQGLAGGIGVSPAAALAVADHLVGLGLVERSGDGAAQSGWTLSTTAAGVRLVIRDRRAQLVSLRRLLGQLGPSRLLVMERAMVQLARAHQPLAPAVAPAAPSGQLGPALKARRRAPRQQSSPPGGPLGRRDSGLSRPSPGLDPGSMGGIGTGGGSSGTLSSEGAAPTGAREDEREWRFG
jgi:DNA-binding MarR family transcriptional regulator